MNAGRDVSFVQPARHAPEVIQVSAMDCGPAVLKSALEGLGVSVHLGHLREACETDVDGTSIDTLQTLAQRLGLRAVQTLVPVAHLRVPEALPLPAVLVLEKPDRMKHFVLLWRRRGAKVQVMDPSRGRLWMRWEDLLREVHVHRAPVSAQVLQRWVRGPSVMAGLGARLMDIGASDDEVEELLTPVLEDVDAGSRLHGALGVVQELVETRSVARGPDATALLRALLARDDGSHAPLAIQQGRQGLLQGAVVLQLSRPEGPGASATGLDALDRALTAPQPHPLRVLGELILRSFPGVLGWSVTVACVMALGGLLQGVLLRGLLDAGRWLQTPGAQVGAVAALAAVVALVGGLGWLFGLWQAQMGRRLELQVRLRLHERLPRLDERYFSSRLTGDLAERAHALVALRGLPGALYTSLSAVAALLGTCLGVAWIDPVLLPMALVSVAASVAGPLLVQDHLARRELRRQTFDGAVSRIQLDAMLGAQAVAAHGAQETLRREQEALLVGWRQASEEALDARVLVSVVQGSLGLGLAAAMVQLHLTQASHAAAALLLVYWGTGLPRQGEALVKAFARLPALQGVATRLLEVLDAPEEAHDPSIEVPRGPLGISARGTVQAGGRPLLHLDLHIAPGEHVAIVGPSGAGKSTLLAAILGWRSMAEGGLRVGGVPVEPASLRAIRRAVAWVDPAVQLWNDSLLANLRYGQEDAPLEVDQLLQGSELLQILGSLPEGLSTALGQDGGRLSGGQGQRVRLARALARPGVGLALLDEAFRGLERPARERLMALARTHWREATLLAVTHDVSDTLSFPRVIVIEGGRVVQDGAPEALMAQDGPYAAMVRADETVRGALHHGEGWRHLRMADGGVHEEASHGAR